MSLTSTTIEADDGADLYQRLRALREMLGKRAGGRLDTSAEWIAAPQEWIGEVTEGDLTYCRRILDELPDPEVLLADTDPAVLAEIAADLAPGQPGDVGQLHVQVIAALAGVSVLVAAAALCNLQDQGIAGQLATDPTVWRFVPPSTWEGRCTPDELRVVLVAAVRAVLDPS